MITAVNDCPSCHRRLFPTRKGEWPFHYTVAGRRVWCRQSGKPIPTSRKTA